MQTKDELEFQYKQADPWRYQTNPDDIKRRDKICDLLREKYQGFSRALDLGAGEGWITIRLPAAELHGYELSDLARSRMPFGVTPITEPEGLYDLVVATGVLYRHYDYEKLLKIIKNHASKVVLTSSMAHAEISELGSTEYVSTTLGLKQVYVEEFPYFNGEQMTQRLRIFEKL